MSKYFAESVLGSQRSWCWERPSLLLKRPAVTSRRGQCWLKLAGHKSNESFGSRKAIHFLEEKKKSVILLQSCIQVSHHTGTASRAVLNEIPGFETSSAFILCLEIWTEAGYVSHNLASGGPRQVRWITISRKRRMIDGGCYLSSDLVELSLPLAFIRGRKKGFCTQSDPDITPLGVQRNMGKSALGSDLPLRR